MDSEAPSPETCRVPVQLDVPLFAWRILSFLSNF